jgi:predicted permease
MRRNLGFTAVVVVTLALGIGANSAMFSFSDAILLRPLPVTHSSEVLRVSDSTGDDALAGVSYPDYLDLRETSRSFPGLIADRLTTLAVATTPTEPPRIRQAMLVSDNFFRTLDIEPSLGRTFALGEGRVPDRDPLAILGYDFWTAEYLANRSAIGQTIRLNGIEFTIIGVAPKSFPGMDRFFPPSVFVPISMWGRLEGKKEEPLEDRARHELDIWGRLGAGVSRESAQLELTALGRNLQRSYPKTDSGRRVIVRTELQAVVAKEPSRLAMVAALMGLSGVVLIIVCVNVANLVLARARARSREIAIRLSIGAGRIRLLRQLMAENLALALLGGLVGLAFGYGGIVLLSRIQIPSDPPFVLDFQMDARLLLFSLFLALASCLLFGLAPALQAGRAQLVPALKAGGNIDVGRTRWTIGRNSLVVSQIALAVVLLLAASALLGGFRKMLTVNPGFRTDHLVAINLDPSVLGYSPDQIRSLYRRVIGEVQALPGVASVTLAESVPLSLDQARMTVIPEGFELPKGREDITELGGAVDENYFSTLKIKILSGRAFDADDRSTSRRVAIVNEEFAKRYWPSQTPIGKRLRLDRADGPMAEVVGVAGTVHYLLPWEQPQPYVYLPFEQTKRSRMNLIAESRGDPVALEVPLGDTIRKLDANLPVHNLRTVASFRSSTLSSWLVLVQMIMLMGILGLILALVGLYGLLSYTVSRRTAEIGVRMALGASRGDVLRLVLRQAISLATSGIAVGLVLMAIAAPVVSAGFVGVGAMSVASYVAIPALLLIVTVGAGCVPARRAAMLDPARALRPE